MTGAPAHGGLRVRLGDVGHLYSFVPPLVWLGATLGAVGLGGVGLRGTGHGARAYSTGPSTVEATSVAVWHALFAFQ